MKQLLAATEWKFKVPIDQREEIILHTVNEFRKKYLDIEEELAIHRDILEDLRKNKNEDLLANPFVDPLFYTPGYEFEEVNELIMMITYMSDENPEKADLKKQLKEYDPDTVKYIFTKLSIRLFSKAEQCKELIILDLENTIRKREEVLYQIGKIEGYTLQEIEGFSDEEKENMALQLPTILAAGTRIARENLEDLRMEMYLSSDDPGYAMDDENWQDDFDITDIKEKRIQKIVADNKSKLLDEPHVCNSIKEQLVLLSTIIESESNMKSPYEDQDIVYKANELLVSLFVHTSEDNRDHKNIRKELDSIGKSENKVTLKYVINKMGFEYLHKRENLKHELPAMEVSSPINEKEIQIAKLDLFMKQIIGLRHELAEVTDDPDFYVPRNVGSPPERKYNNL